MLRWSLVFVWLATAVASAVERNGQSHALLAATGLVAPSLEGWVIWSGVAVDTALGLALMFRPGRATCLAALATMAGMTLVASILSPQLWLHPLGPLTKNLPIAAILWRLAKGQE